MDLHPFILEGLVEDKIIRQKTPLIVLTKKINGYIIKHMNNYSYELVDKIQINKQIN